MDTINNALDITYDKWTMGDTVILLKCLQKSYNFSKAINCRFEMSVKLQKAD